MTPIDRFLYPYDHRLPFDVRSCIRDYLSSASAQDVLLIAAQIAELARSPSQSVRDLSFDAETGTLLYLRLSPDQLQNADEVVHGFKTLTPLDGYRIVRAFLADGKIVTFQRLPGSKEPDMVTWGDDILRRAFGTIRLDRMKPGEAGGKPYWLEMHGRQGAPDYYEQVHWWDHAGPRMEQVFMIRPSEAGPIYTGVNFHTPTQRIQMGDQLILDGLRGLGDLVPWKDGYITRIELTEEEAQLYYFSPNQSQILDSGYRVWGPLVVGEDLAYGIPDPASDWKLIHWGTGNPLALSFISQFCSPSRRPDLLVVAGRDVEEVGGVWVNTIRVHTGAPPEMGTIRISPSGTTLTFRTYAPSDEDREVISIDLTPYDLAPPTDT